MTPSTTISLLWLFTVAIRAIPFSTRHLQTKRAPSDTYVCTRLTFLFFFGRVTPHALSRENVAATLITVTYFWHDRIMAVGVISPGTQLAQDQIFARPLPAH